MSEEELNPEDTNPAPSWGPVLFYAALLATLAFAMVVATIPTGERESGFLELILARPVPRRRYLLAALLPLIFGAVLLPLALVAGALIGIQLVEADPDVSTDSNPGWSSGLFWVVAARLARCPPADPPVTARNSGSPP